VLPSEPVTVTRFPTAITVWQKLLSPQPSTDMHHTFEVDEILRIIASSIEYENRKDAVSFACCCKSFSDPALDAIWGIWQRCFATLLRTLPPSTWTIVDKTFVSFPTAQPFGVPD